MLMNGPGPIKKKIKEIQCCKMTLKLHSIDLLARVEAKVAVCRRINDESLAVERACVSAFFLSWCSAWWMRHESTAIAIATTADDDDDP